MKTSYRTAARAKRRWQADPSSIYRTMSKIQPLTSSELAELQTPVRLAYERLRSGTAHDGDFDTLAAALNISVVRGESIDPLCVHTAQLAQDALIRARDRYERIGRWGFDGQALQDIPPAIDLYEQPNRHQRTNEAISASCQSRSLKGNKHATSISSPERSVGPHGRLLRCCVCGEKRTCRGTA